LPARAVGSPNPTRSLPDEQIIQVRALLARRHQRVLMAGAEPQRHDRGETTLARRSCAAMLRSLKTEIVRIERPSTSRSPPVRSFVPSTTF
jgi:hypothetical protein